MKKVITYGTYDLLHYGHIRLLERAKALGDYLIVGITSEDFDRRRGKINIEQSLMERVQAVKETGLADEIIIEEYEGQKIDDIINYGIDVFTVGSDWEGQFDYLKKYCDVVYLDRTQGVSSSEIRSKRNLIKMGAIGDLNIVKKYINESKYVNGIEISYICTGKDIKDYQEVPVINNYDKLLDEVDALYICSSPETHYDLIRQALNKKKHVLYEPPLTLKKDECKDLFELAEKNGVILMEAMKTNYSQSYNRLILLARTGIVGNIVSIDSNCTSLKQIEEVGIEDITNYQNSICAWGSVGMLPVFQLLGTDYNSKNIISLKSKKDSKFDLLTNINFIYDNAVATVKIGKGAKAESDLIISGTKGYIYVPAPWWKTDYFEVRFENQENNKRYFYKLDGEGIRYELVKFSKIIANKNKNGILNKDISFATVSIIEDYYNDVDVTEIKEY